MSNYQLQTIAPAQALAFQVGIDTLTSMGTLSTLTVQIQNSPNAVIIGDGAATYTFGVGAYGATITGGNEVLKIGSPNIDHIGGGTIVFAGDGDDFIYGGSVVYGGAGADTFIVLSHPAAPEQIKDWEAGDHLYLDGVAATSSNYLEVSGAYGADYAATQIAAGKHYVVVENGGNLTVYSSYQGAPTTDMRAVTLVGRTLADISASNFLSGDPPYVYSTPTTTTGPAFPALVLGDMDSLHFSGLRGATPFTTTTQFAVNTLSGSLTLVGEGLTYDGHGQLTGGLITHFNYNSAGFQLNIAVANLPATTLASWIATDAGPTALATLLSGPDEIHGSMNSDLIRGFGGDDTIIGTGGSDTLFGGEGNDSIQGSGGFDNINGNQGADTIDGGDGGNDWLLGGQGDDQITAHAGANLIYGNLGNDTLQGGSGDDTIRGGQGDDSVVGGAGADWISGDLGDDTLVGGAGADTFNFIGGAGHDRVLDFNPAEGDRILLSAKETYTFTQVGADTVIELHGDQMILVGVTYANLTGVTWMITQ